MSIWKDKVLPQLHKLFGKETRAKKVAAAEASKSFDESKEGLAKELEEKQEELKPKVIEIYESSSTEIKALVKEPKRSGLKKHSATVQKFVEELVKIEFPGSKSVYEATTQYGVALVPGPVSFIFEKVSTLVVTEEKTREIEAPVAATEAAAPDSTTEPPTEPAAESKEPTEPARSEEAPAPEKTEAEVEEKSAEAPAAEPEKAAPPAEPEKAAPPAEPEKPADPAPAK